MLSIKLQDLLFHGHHGIYEEEKILGNEFEVNITVTFLPKSLPVKHIEETIDYVSVYQLVKKRMSVPTPLLETLVTEIAGEILSQFMLAESVSISIRKVNPPISQFRGSIGVSCNMNRAKSI